MTSISLNSEVCQLHAQEERILASFTGRLIEIAAVAGARGSCTSPIAALNAMRLPAIAIDQHGFIADVNAAANGIFDHDIKIKDRRLFVHDPNSRTLLKDAIYQMTAMPRPTPLVMEPIIVPRTDKLPVIVRIWPFDGPAHQPGQPDTFGSEARLHHRARRLSRYRRPRIEDFPGDGAQSVEICLCQDGHASPKRACRTAPASRVTD